MHVLGQTHPTHSFCVATLMLRFSVASFNSAANNHSEAEKVMKHFFAFSFYSYLHGRTRRKIATTTILLCYIITVNSVIATYTIVILVLQQKK